MKTIVSSPRTKSYKNKLAYEKAMNIETYVKLIMELESFGKQLNTLQDKKDLDIMVDNFSEEDDPTTYDITIIHEMIGFWADKIEYQKLKPNTIIGDKR